MDSFTSTVSSQVFYLDGYDTSCSILSIPICYWYKNADSNSQNAFMPPEILERSFYKTLQEFPILAGHLKTDANSRMYIKVDKDNLNMPVYTDTCCDLDYSTMEDSGFNINKLPVDLREGYGVPAPSGLIGGEITPAYIRVIRLKDNSGVLVFARIVHCIVDGYAYTKFMNRWAEISRWMHQPQDDEKLPLPARQYIHDRSLPTSFRSSETTALDSAMLESLSTDNIFTKWLSWISPGTRGRLVKAGSRVDYTCCFFHVSSKVLEDIRTSVQSHAPPGTRYSTNDIITAYTTIAVAQAKKKASADWWSKPIPSAIHTIFGSSQGKSAEFEVTIAVNIRPRVSHPDASNYVGNLALGKSVDVPQDLVQVEPTDEALSALALKVHQLAASADEQYYSQMGYLLESKPDNYLRLMYSSFKNENKFGISNHSTFAHYGVDFGAGIPTMVRHAPHAFNDLCYVMPASPITGGYVLELKLAPDAAANLIQDASWMKLVDRYDCY
ncbi:hypothetical protein IW140_001251 [Coemansia sp. RSA 1813]|nr:hypothetical protein EV178_001159 [Coemansia sp. RSA 1646]KAJ1771735.1 hypothetical protein LPJ74_002037 [Coemansia sp. RSA 1843]KAJ2571902.1 hypothetical protein IW140_001251 [Coemansia sp. RSA 1813]